METWPHLVMERLNQNKEGARAWVGSVGISGFSTVNHLTFVKTSPLMQEVDALIFLIGANDFNHFLRDGLQESLHNVKPIWRNSPMLGLVLNWWERRPTATGAENPTGSNIPVRRMKRQKSRIRNILPDLDGALRQYEARVLALVSLAQRYRLRPIFVTQPTLWDENLSDRGKALLSYGEITEDEYLSVTAGRLGIDKYNEVVMSICTRMGIECINTESMNGQERYFYDDFHFTEAGAAELARIVARHLSNHSDP